MALIKITEDSPAARLVGVNRDTLNNGDLSADVTSPKCKECLGTEEPQVDNTYNNYAAGPECLRVHFDMEFTDNNHVGISQLTKLVRSTGADGATATKVLSNEVIAEVRNGTKVTGLPARLNKRLRGADVLRCDFNE